MNKREERIRELKAALEQACDVAEDAEDYQSYIDAYTRAHATWLEARRERNVRERAEERGNQMTEYCQKCGIRTTPEEPLCQCVDVLHAEIDRLRLELDDVKAAFLQACEVVESAQWRLMQDVSTMRANRERLLK